MQANTDQHQPPAYMLLEGLAGGRVTVQKQIQQGVQLPAECRQPSPQEASCARAVAPPSMHAVPEAVVGKSPGSEEAERWSRSRPYQGTIVAIDSLCQLSSADDKVRCSQLFCDVPAVLQGASSRLRMTV